MKEVIEHNEAMMDLSERIYDLIYALPDEEQQCSSVYALSRVLGVMLAAFSTDQNHLVRGLDGIQQLLRREALDAWAGLAAGQ